MPRFRVAMERCNNQRVTVVVEAADAFEATDLALSAEFDQSQLNCQRCDPGDLEIYAVEEVGESEGLTPTKTTGAAGTKVIRDRHRHPSATQAPRGTTTTSARKGGVKTIILYPRDDAVRSSSRVAGHARMESASAEDIENRLYIKAVVPARHR